MFRKYLQKRAVAIDMERSDVIRRNVAEAQESLNILLKRTKTSKLNCSRLKTFHIPARDQFRCKKEKLTHL